MPSKARKGRDKAAKELNDARGFLNLCTILAQDEKLLSLISAGRQHRSDSIFIVDVPETLQEAFNCLHKFTSDFSMRTARFAERMHFGYIDAKVDVETLLTAKGFKRAWILKGIQGGSGGVKNTDFLTTRLTLSLK